MLPFRVFLIAALSLYPNICNCDNSAIFGNITVIFVADELRRGIIPAVNECWKEVQTASNDKKLNSEFEKNIFWSNIMIKNLKPFHTKIMEIDQMVLAHAPSTVLDPIVNLTTFNSLQNATDKVDKNAPGVEWLDKVKVGWVRVQSIMSQINWKYDWVFDPIFEHGYSNDVDIDMKSIIEETERLYFAWNPVEGRGKGSENYHLNINELTNSAKTVMTGTEKPAEKHDLFYGLEALLNLQEAPIPDAINTSKTSNKSCIGSQEFAGIRPKQTSNYIPVYVLLHLLNAEFKYYIIRNVANMYLCVHSRKCDFENSIALQKHLDEFYEFYFGGIIRVFSTANKPGKNDEDDSKTWRWRCDPTKSNGTKSNYVEDLTYTRFFDFETAFVADEQELSATQSCRETCDSFDGGFSKIPCPEVSWSCLGQEGDFDCVDKIKHAIPCPDSSTRRVCPHGIRCETTEIQQAKVCMGNNSSRRYLDWIDTDNYKKYLGRKSVCASKNVIDLKTHERVERSEISKYEPQKCEICLCKCFEPLGNETHRFIGLIPQVTNVKDGFVMVGTKFTKIQNVIHAQIAEGKLVHGVIDKSTVRWIELQPANASDNTQVFRLGSESRKVLLDDLTVPDGFALTGLRFAIVKVPALGDYEKTSHEAKYSLAHDDTLHWKFGFVQQELRLEAQLTAINHDVLDPSTSKWISNQNSSLSREAVELVDPDVSIFSTRTSEPISHSNVFVAVQSTSLKKDASQTPVPFFDAQELIEPTDISALTNIGLFLKGIPGFGGFLAFRFRSKAMTESPPNSTQYELWKLIDGGLYSQYTKAL